MKIFQVVDVEKLDAAHPEAAVRQFELSARPNRIECDVAIVGGGTGGVAAAITACTSGLKVCLIEETSWLGGQLTAQGVSAPDENYLVETTGATRTYQQLREDIRNHYRSLGGKDGAGRFEPYIDPGNCWVSRIAFEPKVAVKIISKMLQPFIEDGRLTVFLRSCAVELKLQRQKIHTVRCVELDSGKFFDLNCGFCIDATELGDLLPLAGMRYRSGAESCKETGEAHAPELANPQNVQDFTYPFVVEFRDGENHKIPKPPLYDKFNSEGRFSLVGYRMFENSTKLSSSGTPVELLPFWEYRRLIARSNFEAKAFPLDISMINWESNDLRGENIIDQDAQVKAHRLALGKHLSLGFLYWLQNEAARDDGGKGYPEMKLRPDVLGCEDGLSKYPYIRESRRTVALKTVVESDLTIKDNPFARAKSFSDSLGIGLYPIDIHGHQDVPGAQQSTKPFQIPASCMVQEEVRNFLPAAKNIGVTHITNGAYRLHPIEWALGEAAGFFAAEVLRRKTDVLRCYRNKNSLRRIQRTLLEFGSPLLWFDDLTPKDEAFVAVQWVSLRGLMPLDPHSLHFRPADHVTRGEFAFAACKLLRLRASETGSARSAGLSKPDASVTELYSTYIHLAVANGLLAPTDNENVEAEISLRHLAELEARPSDRRLTALRRLAQGAVKASADDRITRKTFACWLDSICCE